MTARPLVIGISSIVVNWNQDGIPDLVGIDDMWYGRSRIEPALMDSGVRSRHAIVVNTM